MDFETNLEHETTNYLASVAVSGSTAVSAPASTVLTADELRERLASAKDELTNAINNGDLEQMTALKAEIKSLPDAVKIAEIRELKQRLIEIELERATNAENIRLINLVRQQKNAAYAEKVRELESYAAAVNEWDLKLSFANNDEQILLGERREKKSKLFSLSESLLNE